MPTKEGIVVIPRQPRPTRSAIEPVVPEPTGGAIELPKTLEVRRAPVVLVVAPELGIEGLLLLVHRRMTMLLAPSTDRRQASAEPFVHRPYMHRELPSSAVGAEIRKTEKAEGAGFPPLPLRSFLRITAKFHEPCLLRVKHQTVFCKPLR